MAVLLRARGQTVILKAMVRGKRNTPQKKSQKNKSPHLEVEERGEELETSSLIRPEALASDIFAKTGDSGILEKVRMMERWGGIEVLLITDVPRRVDPDIKLLCWPGAAPLERPTKGAAVKGADKGMPPQGSGMVHVFAAHSSHTRSPASDILV